MSDGLNVPAENLRVLAGMYSKNHRDKCACKCEQAISFPQGSSRDVNSILVNREEANSFLHSKRDLTGRRRLKQCGGGQWFEYGFWSDSCHSCGTGRYQNSNSHQEAGCKVCPVGQYQNSIAQAGCKGCPTGQYQNSNAQTVCKHCPTGQYQNSNKQTGCKHCPTGQYQNSNAQTWCKHCTNGTFYFFLHYPFELVSKPFLGFVFFLSFISFIL